MGSDGTKEKGFGRTQREERRKCLRGQRRQCTRVLATLQGAGSEGERDGSEERDLKRMAEGASLKSAA